MPARDPSGPACSTRSGSGQTITVDPEHDLTFVQFATDSDLSLALSEAILERVAAPTDPAASLQ